MCSRSSGQGQPTLNSRMPSRLAARLVDAEIVQRLAHVEIALADGDDAELRAAAAGIDDAVEAVGADEGRRGGALVLVQPRLLAELVDLVADVEAAGRHVEFRDDDVQPVERRVDRSRRFDVVLDAFDRRPGAGEARQRIAVEAVVDQLLDPGRIEDRDHRVDEQELGRMRVGRGFGHVVVAHQGEHAAMPRRAGEIGMAEDVAGAVDARALAVPEREHAVMLALAQQLGLLRPPAGGGREFLVEAGLEDDVRLRRAASWPSKAAGRGRRAASRDSRRRSRRCSAQPGGRARAASEACG